MLFTSDTSINPAETELYYLNSRYYSPEFGRFINADGIIDNRGLITQNLFEYCGNNPVNNYDPSGNFFISGTIGVFTGIGIVLVGIAAILTVNQTADIIKSVVESTSNISNTNNQSVYILTDPNDSDKIKYVGRTNDLERREIAVGKLPSFADELRDIIALYGSITEDELMNLMGR